MKLFLIGSPVSHSRSPSLHRSWFIEHDIAATYDSFDVKPEELNGFDFKNFYGGNVTAPLKQAVINYCDVLDQSAVKVGAVNTIKIIDGMITGYNTDTHGLSETLRGRMIKKAAVLGAGGAARAVLSVLQGYGAHVTISSRTRSKAEKLAEAFDCVVEDNPDDYDLIVNATGTMPDGIRWNCGALAFDLSYGNTAFLQSAEHYGLQAMDGTDMHRLQAAKSFEIWFNRFP